MKRVLFLTAIVALGGCAVAHDGFGNGNGNGTTGTGGDGGTSFGGNGSGGGGGGSGGAAVIYAHSDTELYSMDPSTQAITDIGAFDDGSSSTPVITDLAVDGQGNVWVNSESAIYRASIPSSPGTVKITLVSKISLKQSQKFYALGFAPAGVLGSGETLVAGDNYGVLYAVESDGGTTELGSFGTDGSGNPYELSGDVVFYTQNGTARGLATVRSCQKSGSCSTSNDILAEIDVAAMSAAYASKTPASSLKKQLLGSGTGYGRLFGVGAWNDSVYAFARASSGTPAELVRIDGSGHGTVLQTFGQISAGWSGAGVTTAAPITVLPVN
jgi:hypothetical protein